MLEGHGRKPSFYTNEGALVASWITPALRVRAIAMQLSLRRPVQTVPIERQEMWALDGLIWTAALPLSEALVAQTVEDSNVLASLFLLHDRGFGSIALTHPCGERPEEQALRVLNEHLGAGTNAGCFTLWAVPDVPATEEQKAAWRRAQAARVSVIPLPTLREMVAP
jgi:hypothetical protein